MAKRFLTDIDLSKNQLINASFEKRAADPTASAADFEGRMYYNTTSDTVRIYNGTSWIAVGAITAVNGTASEVDVSTTSGVVTVSLPATINADTTGNAATATKLATSRTIELTGDVTGSASFDGSANASITATIAANSVALGTDTTGDYVAGVTASDGISATGTGEGASVALTNTDKGSSQNIFKNVAVAGQTTIAADTNNDTLTVAGGTGITVTTNDTTDTITVANSGVTTIAGTASQITASASTGSVTLSLPSAVTFPGSVTLNADPTTALGAATKQYVDALAQGLHVHASTETATTANIADFDNPPAAIDGVTLVDQMRVLVKNQTTTSQNGIYVYDLATTALVRASDFNSTAEIQGGDFLFVTGGATYDNTGWVQTEKVTTLDTDPIVFQQFSGAGTYSAGNGLTLTGSSFSINTGVTADLSTAQTLTNKTLTSPVVSGLYLSDNNIIIEGTNDTNETTLVFTDPTADRTITFQDATGTVAFTGDITTAIDAITTTVIEEGTNLYFTDERAQDAVGTILVDGTTIDFTYTDGTPSITAEVILKSSNSYLSSTSGLNVDISALETKLTTDGYTKKVSANVGNGTNTSFAITHSLGTRDIQVQVYDNATYDTVEVDVVRTSTTVVTVSFATVPTSDAYRVVVVG
jgi:hypothetical protein